MDKNTITGLVLIGLLLIGFTYFSRPSEEQMAAWRLQQDSIAQVQQREAELKAQAEAALANEKAAQLVDSTATFFQARQGVEKLVVIENEVLKLTLTNKGGRIFAAELKDYKDMDGGQLVLFKDQEASMNFFFYNLRETMQTQDLYFVPVEQTANSVIMRLATAPDSYIDFVYVLQPDNYLVDFTIHAVNMEDKLARTTNYVDIEWTEHARRHERGSTYENQLSNLQYKFAGSDKTKNLSASSDEQKSVPERLHWIAFKNQFFSAALISDKYFEKTELSSAVESNESMYVKDYAAKMNTFFDPTGAQPTQLYFYIGPNHYKTLVALDNGRAEKLDLDNLVYLGWPILRWINKWFTINIFYWFSNMGLSMGIVLLLMTIIVKIVIFPATWKMYMSSAKMRVLKPQIDTINAKYPNQDDAMKKQQEVMGLYSQYGVSPMGGCLPMLLQFPIIMALFTFVPSAIDLRGQSFLWAHDLSTYDDIIRLPFNIPFLGSHISLFCLLMTVTTIINAKITMTQQDTGANPQMKMMKWMQYLMPIMFLFILNSYPAGLNYYYFISTLISILTMYVLKKTTNEKSLLAQLEVQREKNKSKQKPGGGFAARLAAMQQEQQRIAEERAKQQRKR